MEHKCDQVEYLRELDQKITEVRALLFGTNGTSGFVEDTKEVLEIVRAAVNTFANQVPIVERAVTALTGEVADLRKVMRRKPITWGQVLTLIGIFAGVIGSIVVALVTIRGGGP